MIFAELEKAFLYRRADAARRRAVRAGKPACVLLFCAVRAAVSAKDHLVLFRLYAGGADNAGGYAHCEATERCCPLLDVLVTAGLSSRKSDISLRFRGSKNQRLIDLNRTREEGRVVLWED